MIPKNRRWVIVGGAALMALFWWNGKAHPPAGVTLDLPPVLLFPMSVGASPDPVTKETVQPAPIMHAAVEAHVVQLYDYGSIALTKPKEPKAVNAEGAPARDDSADPKTAPSEKTLPPARAITPPQRPASIPANTSSQAPEALKAQPLVRQVSNSQMWPVLVANYSAIGIDAYLKAIARLGGRFHVLVKDRIGPEVDMVAMRVLGPAIDSGLALKHPHFVEDKEIRARLELLQLPLGANREGVVLLLSGWFNRVLWGTVADGVMAPDLKIQDLAEVEASYVKADDGFFLHLGNAKVRATGGTVRIDRLIQLPG